MLKYKDLIEQGLTLSKNEAIELHSKINYVAQHGAEENVVFEGGKSWPPNKITNPSMVKQINDGAGQPESQEPEVESLIVSEPKSNRGRKPKVQGTEEGE